MNKKIVSLGEAEQQRQQTKMPAEKPIGMMNDAYFVGRKELLTWLNTFFKFSYERIEQVCTGAAHCQIMDAIYPGQVQLNKVNFYARFDYEYMKNYKLLQNIFNKMNISKVIDVNRLIKGKYQDNLEFLQWMKRYFDTTYDGSAYDALARRTQAIKDYDGKWTSKPMSTTTNTANSVPVGNNSSSNNNVNNSFAIRRSGPGSTVGSGAREPVAQRRTSSRLSIPQPDEATNSKLRQLGIQNTELRQEVTNLERERDFYFQKLRDIEVLCQDFVTAASTSSPPSAQSVVEHIQNILFATEEDFVSVDDLNLQHSNDEQTMVDE